MSTGHDTEGTPSSQVGQVEIVSLEQAVISIANSLMTLASWASQLGRSEAAAAILTRLAMFAEGGFLPDGLTLDFKGLGAFLAVSPDTAGRYVEAVQPDAAKTGKTVVRSEDFSAKVFKDRIAKQVG